MSDTVKFDSNEIAICHIRRAALEKQCAVLAELSKMAHIYPQHPCYIDLGDWSMQDRAKYKTTVFEMVKLFQDALQSTNGACVSTNNWPIYLQLGQAFCQDYSAWKARREEIEGSINYVLESFLAVAAKCGFDYTCEYKELLNPNYQSTVWPFAAMSALIARSVSMNQLDAEGTFESLTEEHVVKMKQLFELFSSRN